jgi:hypothetical protein
VVKDWISAAPLHRAFVPEVVPQILLVRPWLTNAVKALTLDQFESVDLGESLVSEFTGFGLAEVRMRVPNSEAAVIE